MNIVIDINVFISAIVKDSLTRSLIINSNYNLLFPEFELQEIYKYKQEIMKKSGYSELEFIKIISILMKYMKIISIESIRDKYQEASIIIGSIDDEDIIFIATALAFDAAIWSDDKHFKQQNSVKVFNTKEFLEISKEE